MQVKAILNVATTPDELFYRDEADTVIYLPEGLEGLHFRQVNRLIYLQAIDIAQAWGAKITLMMCVKIDEEISAFEQVRLGEYIPSKPNAAAYEVLIAVSEDLIRKI